MKVVLERYHGLSNDYVVFDPNKNELELTPGNYYNFHPGSHVGQGAEVGISKIAEILNEVLTKDQSTIVLLEVNLKQVEMVSVFLQNI